MRRHLIVFIAALCLPRRQRLHPKSPPNPLRLHDVAQLMFRQDHER